MVSNCEVDIQCCHSSEKDLEGMMMVLQRKNSPELLNIFTTN